jgi:hypothetical protein
MRVEDLPPGKFEKDIRKNLYHNHNRQILLTENLFRV